MVVTKWIVIKPASAWYDEGVLTKYGMSDMGEEPYIFSNKETASGLAKFYNGEVVRYDVEE